MSRIVLASLILAGAVGCEAPNLDVQPLRQSLEVTLDPNSHRLEAESTTVLRAALTAEGRWIVRLELNEALPIDRLEVEGATLRRWRMEEGDPARVRLVLEDPSETITLSMSYAGTLKQDVAAGEDAEEIHNFAVSAHVAPEGIFLEPGGHWYPTPVLPDTIEPARTLTHFELSVEPIEGFELVAGAERLPGESHRWKSSFPLEGLVLLGGPLERHSRVHDGIELHAVLAPGKAAVAEDILDASAEYLDRYVPLIGPYPFREFTVLEAFFSSGFAFPTCTQIAGVLLNERKQYRRHGYLDHELLHAWWGNGIYTDPRDGNWAEGLASYGGNYAGHVLDGNPDEARKTRRNFSNFLSDIDAQDDKPLGSFGLDDGAGRGIGYSKGAMLFHMLERKLGSDAFAAGLRRLTAEQLGRHANWETLREAFEAESGEDLATFFEQWVRRGGAPELSLVSATATEVTISQGETVFELDVPLRLYFGERHDDVVVSISEREQTVALPTTARPTAIELDPDYHLFRKLEPEETMPTSGLTRADDRLLIVLPAGDLAEGYATVRDSFRRAVEDDDGSVTEVTVDELESLAETSLLVLGNAVRHPKVAALLARTRSPVRFGDGSFTLDATEYDQPTHATYFTVHHPDDAGRGITVYHGNSPAALSNAGVLNFYPNSLLVFESPREGPGADASGMPRARVVERRDFEFHARIEL